MCEEIGTIYQLLEYCSFLKEKTEDGSIILYNKHNQKENAGIPQFKSTHRN